MKLKKFVLSLFLSLSMILNSVNVFASNNALINIIPNEIITVNNSDELNARWGIGALGLSADGNYVEVKCIGFDSGTLAVKGKVSITNRAGKSAVMPFDISCSGIYNQIRSFYFNDWKYAEITSAFAYGPDGQYTVVSLPEPIKR